MTKSSIARPRLYCGWALSAALVTSFVVDARLLRADSFVVTGQRYHAQVTDHYCASATIMMMLDCTAVRSTNPWVNTFLMAPEAPFVPPARHVVPGAPIAEQIPQQPVYNAGKVLFAPQVAVYNLIHNNAVYTPTQGPFTGVPLTYNNPFSPWPTAGSGNNASQWALNVLDNPNVGGFGNHSYVAYNVPPTPNWRDWASRTIANAIKNYDVAAQATIGNGAHAIAVTGYTTIGTPGRNQAYDITGFYVNDPWTGYAKSQNLNYLGLGVRSWVKYGWTRNPTKPQVFIPGEGFVNAAPSEWFRYFTPAPGQPGEGAYMSGLGYKFVVEPLGPEEIDDGNGGVLDSIPDLAPLLPAPLDANGALAAALAEISGGNLQNLHGLSGGAFDAAGIQLIDPLDEADWFVPYLREGKYTGAVLVSSYTGEIQKATWLDAGDEYDFSLADFVQMYQDIYADVLPGGNPPIVPEPCALAISLVAWPALGRRRARSAAKLCPTPPSLRRARRSGVLCGVVIAAATLAHGRAALAGSQQFSAFFDRPKDANGALVNPANITYFYLNVDVTVSRNDPGALANISLDSTMRGQHAGQFSSGGNPDPVRPRFELPSLSPTSGTPVAMGAGSRRTDTIQFSFPRRTDFPTTFNANNQLLFGGKFSAPGRQNVSKLTFNNAEWRLNDGSEISVPLGKRTFGFANGSFHFIYENSASESVALTSLQFESHASELDLGSLEPGPVSLGGLPITPDFVVRSDGAGDPHAPLAPGAAIDFGFHGEFPPFMTVQGSVSQGGNELSFALGYQHLPEPSSGAMVALGCCAGLRAARRRNARPFRGP